MIVKPELIVKPLLKTPRSGVLNGLALGFVVATGLSLWVTFLRITAGTVPFTRLETTYPVVIALYYTGGLVGGLLIGLAWPLRKWLLGSAFLGVLGMFPAYFGVMLMNSPQSQLHTAENIGSALFLSCVVGGSVGAWAWFQNNATYPAWISALEFPNPRMLTIAWSIALVSAGGSYFFLAKVMRDWPAGVMLAVFLLLFVCPLAIALLLTLRFSRGR